MFLLAEACRHNLKVILHKINTLDMHLVDFYGNESQQNDENILPQFPIVTVEELKNLNKLLREDAIARAQYVSILCITLSKFFKSLRERKRDFYFTIFLYTI